jgi:hypothetical protein
MRDGLPSLQRFEQHTDAAYQTFMADAIGVLQQACCNCWCKALTVSGQSCILKFMDVSPQRL